MIKVRVGSEYDAAGNDCAVSPECDLDKTFKLCKELKYHAEYLKGSKRPSVDSIHSCATAPDVAGRKNWSLYMRGSQDDCSTNSYLCADSTQWPIVRATAPSDEKRAINLTIELVDRTKGPLHL